MTRSRVGSRYPMRTAMIRVSRCGCGRTIASPNAAGRGIVMGRRCRDPPSWSASGDLADFRWCVAEFAEQFGRVLAEARRRQANRAGRLGKTDRDRSGHELPLAGVVERLEEAG